MNLLLIDDHALFREGLGLLLSKLSPGIVIHEADSVEAVMIAAKGGFSVM